MTALRAGQASEFRHAAGLHVEDVVQLASDIASVPAPTGDEQARAHFVAEWLMREAPAVLGTVETDEMQNVVAVLPGRTDGPPIVLAAHLDTVFPSNTPLIVRRDGDRIHGAGIGDNSLGTAALLLLPRLLETLHVQPSVSIVLAAPVGEEGLGNLRGMRQVMSRYQHAGAAIAIEGHNIGRITATAVGSKRFRVTVTGPGGHSWGDYGRESAIHVLGNIISTLADVPIPPDPKTTFNIGTVEGGISINTIAPTASMRVDLRSIDASILRETASLMERRIADHAGPTTAVEIEILGERPAGAIQEHEAIVQIARESLIALGLSPALDASSTDANIPISMGIPAICLGLTTGGNVHRPDEFIDVGPLADGFAQLGLVVVNLADHLATKA
ncbi:MAG: M20/M25/M40 family metallo-hydrolase [Thermomicrobiales bacterium]